MLFQTHDHRSQEDRSLEWCEDVFRCKAHRYHDKTAPLDFWWERDGRVVAFGDVKSRTTAADQYPTLRMSTRKIANMRLHAALHELPVLLGAGAVGGSSGVSVTPVAKPTADP